MDFIAGRITREEFESVAGMSIDFLKRVLDQGATVTKLSASLLEDEDDDLVTISLAGPDAAVSNFRMPDKLLPD